MTFRKASTIITFVFIGSLFLGAAVAEAVRIQNFTLEYTTENVNKECVLNIEYYKDRTEITYFNEYGDKEVVVYKDVIHPQTSSYYNPDRELTGTSVYNYVDKKIVISGTVNATYDLQEPVFDNNCGLFYLFSVYYPAEGEQIKFKIVQSNLARITDPISRLMITHVVGPIEMRLKYEAKETVTIKEKTYDTIKYSFAISDGTLAAFWPHTYYFWYSVKDRRLIKHTGISNDKKPNQYFLVDFYEWERPIPELPAL